MKIILLDSSGWWQGKNTSGQIGFFPGSYVLPEREKMPQDDANCSFADLLSHASSVVTEIQSKKIQALFVCLQYTMR